MNNLVLIRYTNAPKAVECLVTNSERSELYDFMYDRTIRSNLLIKDFPPYSRNTYRLKMLNGYLFFSILKHEKIKRFSSKEFWSV